MRLTSLRPEASAAAFTLPRRCTLDANWVVMTRPGCSTIRCMRFLATSASLTVRPGERMFVLSLIICKGGRLHTLIQLLSPRKAVKVAPMIQLHNLRVIDKESAGRLITSRVLFLILHLHLKAWQTGDVHLL
jgi:hypothetical protein